MSKIVRSPCPWCEGEKAKYKQGEQALRCTLCKRERPAPAYLSGVSA
ncbi:hypothetical protein [Methanoculleus sp. UBA312]